MCTVTYIPKEKSGYILTSNRDEKVERPSALLPEAKIVDNQTLLFPIDALHSGTWIASSDTGRTLCLLNGGFKKHIPDQSYKKSRGLVVIDAFKYLDAQDFILRYDLSGIEPFTLIFIDQMKLFEIRWDGQKSYIKKLNELKPYIWSSVTLYSEEVIQQRKKWFENWLSISKEFSVDSCLNFHQLAGEGDLENRITMNRNDILKTVSITSVHSCGSKLAMQYLDLKSGQKSNTELNLKLKRANESVPS